MASLLRLTVLGAASVLSAAALILANPSPPQAEANVACDLGGGTVAPVTGALGIGNPVGDACEAIADAALGALPNPLDPIKDAAGSIGGSVFGQITSWAADGAVWLLRRVAELSDKTTSPNLLGKGFLRQYREMAQIATLLALAMGLLAVLESLGRGDGGMLARVFLINAPLAAIATSAAYVVVQLLIATTDGLSHAVAQTTAEDTRVFFKSAIEGLAGAGASVGGASGGAGAGSAAGGAAAPLFVGFIAAILAAFAAFFLWIELLMRDAAIYAVALFMPLALAASIWPRWTSALRRTAELVIVVVFSKFVIVAIIALAASLLANTGGRVEHVLAAGALLFVACFAPFVLFRLVPFAEGAVGAAFHRQSAGGAAVRTVEFGSSVQMMRRAAIANWGMNGSGARGGAAGGGGGGGGGQWRRAVGGERSGGGAAGGASGEVAAVAPAAAVGVEAARAGRAGAAKLAGTATMAAAGDTEAASGSSAQKAEGADRSSGDGQRPRSAERAAEQLSLPSASPAPEPSEAKGGRSPGEGARPPRPAGEVGATEERAGREGKP